MITTILYRVGDMTELIAYVRFCLRVCVLLACVIAAPMVVALVLPVVLVALPWVGCAVLLGVLAYVSMPR